MNTDASDRRYEFDWLRVFAILMVFLYHSTRFFNLGDWHVKNADTFVWVEIWNIYAMSWLMPLFFIISGASLFYAIGKSGGWLKFTGDKFRRLMIPLLAATVTHAAVQVYLERLTHGHFSGSFFSFLPEYFNGVYVGIGMPFGNFAFHGMHLWFLLFLFCDSLICYHLFLWLKGNGSAVLARMISFSTMPGLIYLWFAIPLFIMKAILPADFLNAGAGSWGFLYYLWFLIAGFMIVSSERLQRRIKDQRWISLLLGAVLSTALLYQLFSPSRVVLPDLSVHWVNASLYFISAWCWLFAILGFGMRFLAFDRPLLQHANEGVLPFYILHQPVLLVTGYFIMSFPAHGFLKWAIVFSSSLIVIISLYIFAVRKFDGLRFLFGMKTSHPFFAVFRRKRALLGLIALYVGLIAFAISGVSVDRSPMPLTYAPEKDIVLNIEFISGRSLNGVHVVNDGDTSIGQAIEFSAHANQRPESHPKVYVDMRFAAPAGRYAVWLRGKSSVDGTTDSVWLQIDDQIGTRKGLRAGNWLDVHPAGIYAWAGDSAHPIAIELKHSGDHAIRIQPRQTPHRIDQIWLSRFQRRIPDTSSPIR